MSDTPETIDFSKLFSSARETGNYDAVNELIPYAHFLGFRLEHDKDGGPLFVLPFDPRNIGNVHLPAIHGGVIAGFLENAAIMHLLYATESTTMPKPINCNIDYLRSGRPIETYAKCEVTKQGRRIANVSITAWQDNPDKLIASARYHFKVTPEIRS